ncbi:MAG: hypothetical protein FWE49_03140, partial [Synergistaceae bacterium]|nr:hypothetical protein [Synergistaceae bacterium]
MFFNSSHGDDAILDLNRGIKKIEAFQYGSLFFVRLLNGEPVLFQSHRARITVPRNDDMVI